MINNVFITLLMVISVMVGLITEALKQILDEKKIKYSTNVLAAVISVVASFGIGIGYIIFYNVPFSPQIIVQLIALVVLGWLVAMLGYDKIIQSITQISKK